MHHPRRPSLTALAVLVTFGFAACGPQPCRSTSCEQGGAHSAGDSATDTGGAQAVPEPGKGFYLGEVTTNSDGSFAAGSLDYEVTDAQMNAVCDTVVQWQDAGTAAPTCARCQWTFTFVASAAKSTGSGCAGLSPDPLAVTGSDGLTSAWGFKQFYQSYDVGYGGYGGYTITEMMYYSTYPGSEGWQVFASNYGGYEYARGSSRNVLFRNYLGYTYFYQ